MQQRLVNGWLGDIVAKLLTCGARKRGLSPILLGAPSLCRAEEQAAWSLSRSTVAGHFEQVGDLGASQAGDERFVDELVHALAPPLGEDGEGQVDPGVVRSGSCPENGFSGSFPCCAHSSR